MQLYAGVVPVDDRGLAALQQRDQTPGIENAGMLTAFGGLAEPGEDAAAAALREAAEELDLNLPRSALRPLLSHEKRLPGSAPTWCVIFRVTVPDVRLLRTTEGVGVVTGVPAELLNDRRLTDTCRRAIGVLCT